MVRKPAPPPERAHQLQRRMLRESSRGDTQRDAAFRRVIRSVPNGMVSTYGAVAAAAGYPMYQRAVARLLRTEPPGRLPWHRIIGAGGYIRLQGEAAQEQRLRLTMEGVRFRGRRVDMDQHQHPLRPWEP